LLPNLFFEIIVDFYFALGDKILFINFNKAEDIAYVFTYEKTWQKHLEKKLGIEPTLDNGYGGKGYELPKKMIKPPRAPRKLSDSAKKKLVERLHRNRVLSAENLVPVAK